MTRTVYVSMNQKNWIFAYTKRGSTYVALNGKKIGPIQAHLPLEFFDYAKVVETDAFTGEHVRTEVRRLKWPS